MSRSTRMLCLYAMGIALFVVLTMCLQVPVFENYYLCLGYAVVAVYCYSFGSLGGAVVGSLGVGAAFRGTRGMKSPILQWALNAIIVVAATAAGVLGLKSLVECVLYGQPFLFRAMKNMYAFIADVVMLLVSLPVCVKMDDYLHRMTRDKR